MLLWCCVLALLVASNAATPTTPGRRGCSPVVRSQSTRRSLSLLRLRGGESILPEIRTEDELEVVLEEAGDALVVVDFFAEWCGPCKKIAPAIEELASKQMRRSKPKVLFYKVDVDQSRELAAASGVKSMPTLQFFRKGKKVHEIVGGDLPALRAEVAKADLPPLVRTLRLDALAAAVLASKQQSLVLAAALGYAFYSARLA